MTLGVPGAIELEALLVYKYPQKLCGSLCGNKFRVCSLFIRYILLKLTLDIIAQTFKYYHVTDNPSATP